MSIRVCIIHLHLCVCVCLVCVCVCVLVTCVAMLHVYWSVQIMKPAIGRNMSHTFRECSPIDLRVVHSLGTWVVNVHVLVYTYTYVHCCTCTCTYVLKSTLHYWGIVFKEELVEVFWNESSQTSKGQSCGGREPLPRCSVHAHTIQHSVHGLLTFIVEAQSQEGGTERVQPCGGVRETEQVTSASSILLHTHMCVHTCACTCT